MTARATTVNPMAFGFDPSVKPYKQDLAQAKKLLAEAGFPNGLEVGFLRTQPTVEPGLIQTSDAIVADLAKAGIRTKARMVGESRALHQPGPRRQGRADVRVVVGLLLDLRRRRDPLRRDDVQPALQRATATRRSTTWSSRAAPRSIASGGWRSTRKAQKLIHDDAAYLFKWGLRGRVGRQQPHRLRGAARRGRPDVGRDAAEEVGGPRALAARARGALGGPGPALMRRYIARQAGPASSSSSSASPSSPSRILHVLGDPVLLLLPQNAGKEEFERYRHLLGLDRPLYVQYWKFVSRAVTGDFGKSWYADTSAFKLRDRAHAAARSISPSPVSSSRLLIALPLGIAGRAASATPGSTASARAVAVAGQAAPIFWLGIMMIIVFSVRLRLAARLRVRQLAELPDAVLLPGRRAGAPSPCAWCAPGSSRS